MERCNRSNAVVYCCDSCLLAGLGVVEMKLLRALKTNDPTRVQIFMARIEQNWREWRSPNSDVATEGWIPIRDYGKALQTDEVLRGSYRKTDEEK